MGEDNKLIISTNKRLLYRPACLALEETLPNDPEKRPCKDNSCGLFIADILCMHTE